jgi:hypothetical protein
MNQTNNPPIDSAGSACFVLTRASGEIEIRGATVERIWQEQLKYPEHRFDNHTQLNELLWAVRGRRVA